LVVVEAVGGQVYLVEEVVDVDGVGPVAAEVADGEVDVDAGVVLGGVGGVGVAGAATVSKT
jgi:hypothetical protein